MATKTRPEVEAEEAVLGVLLLEREKSDEVMSLIQPDYFIDPRNRQVFEAMQTLTARAEPVELISLANEMRHRGTLDSSGGKPRLEQLLGCVTSSAHLAHHARIMYESAAVRRVAVLASELHKSASGATPLNGSASEFLAEAIERMSEAAATPTVGRVEFVRADAGKLRERLLAGLADRMEGLQTGFPGLDQIVCGMRGGDLTILGARPGVGKTSFVLGVAEYTAREPGCLPVLFFSLEMSKAALVERLASARSGVDHYLVRTQRLSDRNMKRLHLAIDEIESLPLAIDDSSTQSLMSIRAAARKFKQRHGLRMLVVDYLQLVQHPAENRLQEVSAVSRGLKSLARELGVPVIAAAQVNRASETAPQARPRLINLRESGSIESDADIVILLHCSSEEYETNESREIEAMVAKNRNGPMGTAKLLFQPTFVRFVSPELSSQGARAAPMWESESGGPDEDRASEPSSDVKGAQDA